MTDLSLEWVYADGWEVVVPADTSIPYEQRYCPCCHKRETRPHDPIKLQKAKEKWYETPRLS